MKNTAMRHAEYSRVLIVTLMVIVLNAEGSDGQVRAVGRCSKLTVTPLNPAVTTYTLYGTWYVTHRTRSMFDLEMQCERFFLWPEGARNGMTMGVFGSSTFYRGVRIRGEMTSTDVILQKWTINFRKTALSSLHLPNLSSTQFTILGTDGADPPEMMVAHLCSPGGSSEATYVLSKANFLDAPNLDKAQNIMLSAGLSNSLKETEQTLCLY